MIILRSDLLLKTLTNVEEELSKVCHNSDKQKDAEMILFFKKTNKYQIKNFDRSFYGTF